MLSTLLGPSVARAHRLRAPPRERNRLGPPLPEASPFDPLSEHMSVSNSTTNGPVFGPLRCLTSGDATHATAILLFLEDADSIAVPKGTLAREFAASVGLHGYCRVLSGSSIEQSGLLRLLLRSHMLRLSWWTTQPSWECGLLTFLPTLVIEPGGETVTAFTGRAVGVPFLSASRSLPRD